MISVNITKKVITDLTLKLSCIMATGCNSMGAVSHSPSTRHRLTCSDTYIPEFQYFYDCTTFDTIYIIAKTVDIKTKHVVV